MKHPQVQASYFGFIMSPIKFQMIIYDVPNLFPKFSISFQCVSNNITLYHISFAWKVSSCNLYRYLKGEDYDRYVWRAQRLITWGGDRPIKESHHQDK